jgi:pyruvoyl-dependent arginine decarboxylase (PvlArgDC)
MNALPVLMPGRLYLAHAVGTAKEDKNARDRASRPISLHNLTLLSGTSALPPGIRLIGQDEFRASVSGGQDVIAIHGVCQSNVPGQLVNSTLSICVPADGQGDGYVAELYEWPGIVPEVAVRRTERMVLQLYAENHGGPFDPKFLWEQGRTRYTVSGREVEITTIQAAGVVNDDGDWCCALAAAVLL